jgi:hypothetical protein
MAAKNTDSQRIFDLYIERFLAEQGTEDTEDTDSGTPAPAPAAPAAAPAAPTPQDIKRYGRTGAELRQNSAGQFMSRDNRLDQSKVDAVLGQGKYKAGTAEANLALANYYKNNPNTVTPDQQAALNTGAGLPANATAADFDARRAAQTGMPTQQAAQAASLNASAGLPANATAADFDARRAAQTGSSAPAAASTASAAPQASGTPGSDIDAILAQYGVTDITGARRAIEALRSGS